RIAFRVISSIDSRTILETTGANQLVGRGDMLISLNGELTRVQCALVDTPEVERITGFIASQQGYSSAHLLPEYTGEEGESLGVGEVDLEKRDKLFDEAAKLVVQFQQGSTSLIQRRMNLGYNRAGRIMDQLEAAGIVGPPEGSKARQVLVTEFTDLDNILSSLN
ncbi:MAG: DNA translocase FtsK, partial [Bacteroidales bacterium]|nr:DNA translocase FtsK [Bacteroidales bacterium]